MRLVWGSIGLAIGGCAPVSPIEAEFSFLEVARVDGGLYVDVHRIVPEGGEPGCVDPTSLLGSALSADGHDAIEPTYLVDRAVLFAGGVDNPPDGVLVDTVCGPDFSFGFEDITAFTDVEGATLTITGDHEDFDLSMTGSPFAELELTPDEIPLATLWGSTVTFTLNGPHEFGPDVAPVLFANGQTAPLDTFTATGDSITVTFPQTNPGAVTPSLVSFRDAIALPEPEWSFIDETGDVAFTVLNQTSTSTYVGVTP